ncbi:MAG: DUF4129 domain-containing protein [Mycobacteriales bacterium]
MTRPRWRTWWPLTAGFLLLALLAATSALSSTRLFGGVDSARFRPPKNAQPADLRRQPPRVGHEHAPLWVAVLYYGVLAIALCGLLAWAAAALYGMFRVVLAATGIRRRKRDARDAVADDPDPEARATQARRLAAALADSMAELEEGDARRAVINAWLRLERTAAGAGTRREVADTAEDLVGKVLIRHDVSPVALRRLADLYREARYSPHDVDEPMRAQARDAFARVAAELTHPLPAP